MVRLLKQWFYFARLYLHHYLIILLPEGNVHCKYRGILLKLGKIQEANDYAKS